MRLLEHRQGPLEIEPLRRGRVRLFDNIAQNSGLPAKPKVMSSPLSPVPPVPPHARRFRTDDLDEVRAAIRRDDGEHSRVSHGSGPLGFEMARVAGDQIHMGWCRTQLGQTVRGSAALPCLHFPVEQGSRYTRGRHAFDAGPGTAVFVAEAAEFTRQSTPGTVFAIGLNGEALAAEVGARRPATAGGWARHPQRFEPGDPRQLALRRAIADLAAGVAAQAGPQRLAQSEADVLAAVAGLIGIGEGQDTVSAISARRLADLEEWIEAHLAEPITLGSLCAVAGVGERALQAAFRSNRGMSPMRFVAERRLAAAHQRLAQGEAGNDVTQIAFQSGFSHLGRFASLYRQVYGEPPSRTLQRRRAGGESADATNR